MPFWILKPLLKNDPHRIAYLLAQAKQQKMAGSSQLALKTYEKALALYPKNEALSLDYVETLLELKQAKKSVTILTPLLHTTLSTPEFYKQLAQAEAQLNNNANRHIALAEYYYQVGQIHQALTQLKLALKDKSADFYQRSRIEARQKQFQDELIERSRN